MDSDWASLPLHLLDSVLGKIEPLMDYLQLSAACVSWNSVAKTNNQSQKAISHQAPMLLMPSEESNLHSTWDPVTNNFLKSTLVLPCDHKRFAGSSHGWLVVVEKDFAVTLYKPYFMVDGEHSTTKNTIIHLPSVFPSDNQEDYVDVFEDYVYKVTITADPVTNLDQCMVMVILSDYYKLAFIRPAKDKTWTYVDSIPPVDEILYYNGRLFYALTIEGELYSLRISDTCIVDVKLAASKPPLDVVGKSYLVKSYEENLFQVVRYLYWTYASDEHDTIVARRTTMVIVYELDLYKGKWVEIKHSLGDLALFLGDNSSISILASNFPRCKPNNIYFTHDKDSLKCGHTHYKNNNFLRPNIPRSKNIS